MITVKQEEPAKCIGTLCQLFAEHGAAVIGPEFNLNIVCFTNAIQAGNMRFFVIRDDDKAVGYAALTIYADIMKADKISADCNAIYVMPEYRGLLSIKLIKLIEHELREQGVNRLIMHVPHYDEKQYAMFMKPKLGYSLLEYTMIKEL